MAIGCEDHSDADMNELAIYPAMQYIMIIIRLRSELEIGEKLMINWFEYIVSQRIFHRTVGKTRRFLNRHQRLSLPI